MADNFEPKGSLAAQAIEGVGKDAPTVTNAHGGRQSHCPYRADLLPPHALLAVAAVLKEGADKYGANNWHKISAADNINHALVHLLALTAGDTTDEHLEHAATRILFALDQVRSGRDAKLAAAPVAAAPSGFKVGDRVTGAYEHCEEGVVTEVFTDHGQRAVRYRTDRGHVFWDYACDLRHADEKGGAA